MSTAETIVTIGILTVAAGVATRQLSVAAPDNKLMNALLFVLAIVIFSYYPAVGLSLVILLIVLMYRANVAALFLRQSGYNEAAAGETTYGDESIPLQNVGGSVPIGFTAQADSPRPYTQFQETAAGNPMLSEGFEPSPYGDEQGAPVDGQFPIQDGGAGMETPDVREYTYRPDAETGDNEFQRFGPDLDEKKRVFEYAGK